MELNERISLIRDTLCAGKPSTFATKLNTNYKRVSGMCDGTINSGRHVLDTILSAFPEESPQWLLTGTGPMMKAESEGDIVYLKALVESQRKQVLEQSGVIKALIETNKTLISLIKHEANNK